VLKTPDKNKYLSSVKNKTLDNVFFAKYFFLLSVFCLALGKEPNFGSEFGRHANVTSKILIGRVSLMLISCPISVSIGPVTDTLLGLLDYVWLYIMYSLHAKR
jgi:hypothetical protein